jgi:hypothetical protein
MIRDLLTSSLIVWKVSGNVECDGEDIVIRPIARPAVRIGPGRSSRWIVQPEDGPPHQCASIVGALTAVREALGVSGGPALRIGPSRREA